MPLPQDAIVQQSPSCLAANVQDELVLMSIEHGQYVALDSIGKDIWEHLAAPCRVDALCRAMIADYDADAEVITADVLEFLDQLRDVDVILVKAA